MKTTLALSAAAVLCCFALSPVQAVSAHDMAAMAQQAAPAAPKLHAALRELWHGHVVHTRDYAFAVHAHDAAKAKAATEAVVANAKQLANAVAGFYGKAAGAQTLQLLAGHWAGVKALTDAVEAGDSAAQAKAMAELNTNVDAIAKFFSTANPNMPEDAVKSLFAAHVGHHAAELQQIKTNDTKGETATWTMMQEHMNVIGDTMAGAIAKQFPTKVS